MSLVWKSAPSIRSKLRSFSELHVRSTPSLSSAGENALIRNSLTGNLGSHVTRPAMADFSHTMYSCLFRGSLARECAGVRNLTMSSSFSRSFASKASKGTEKSQDKAKKDVTTVEDPFDAPTYHIPEKPVTFTEGASYSLVILAGLGVAGAAGYAVFKELIFQPKEYKIFDKALKRIQDDSQVRVRLGSPIKGYGQESRNRAARQRIPNRIHTDEDGVEHVEINFYIRGPQGAGKVFTEMFKDKTDNEWKYTYLIVEITSPSPARLMLESYLPA